MKKILSILLFWVFCVSVSFTFASCANIFAGNYKLVSKEKCEAYFSSIGYSGFELFTDGFCAEIEMKAISGINQSYNFVLRYNKNENIMSGKINSNNEGYIRNSEYYYDGTYFYEKVFSNVDNSIQTSKIFNTYGRYPDDLIDIDIFDMYSDISFGLDDESINYFADFSNGAKIKIVINDKQNKTNNIGEIFFVFNKTKMLKGAKFDIYMKENKYSYIISYKITEYKGRVNIPREVYSWEDMTGR